MSQFDRDECAKLRKQIFLTGYKGGMAHLASCFSSVEIIYTLYRKGVLHYDPQDPAWKDRDRFVLSKGHAGLALYSVLVEAGLVSKEDFATYLQPGCHLGGEPCMRDNPWIEATTGSLGHGLSMAMGIAMALKVSGSPAKVYVLLGDGELEEGTIWEAAMTAPAFGLDNLIAILDCNDIQKMDFVRNIVGEPRWEEKWSSFGWDVDRVDGHDTEAIMMSMKKEGCSGRPRFVIAQTVKGKGVSLMEGNPVWHFKLPNRKELKVFKQELDITDSELE